MLCGGVPELVKAAFDTLVERGYAPEVAYLECLHELKIIADLMYEGGLHYMRERISRTAAWGSFATGPRIIVPTMCAKTSPRFSTEIESGVREAMVGGSAAGQKRLSKHVRDEAQSRIGARRPQGARTDAVSRWKQGVLTDASEVNNPSGSKVQL